MIRLEKVTLRYGDHTVLDSVDLFAPPKKITCILGPSGSGKSTILKLMMGFVKPLSGRVMIGRPDDPEKYDDIATARGRELDKIRERLGLVFQGGALFDSLTLEDNVGFYLTYKLRLPEHQVIKRVKGLLEQVGLSGFEKHMPDELSGGMRKRAALARALIAEPTILLYDEPTTGLDPLLSKVVDEIIRDTNERFKITSVVISHDVDLVMEIGDRTYFLSQGKIKDVGTPKDLRAERDPEIMEFIGSRNGDQ